MIKENKMGVMPIPRLIITMSLPVMFSMLIQALYNIVDSIFVARQSAMALTAVSLAAPVYMVMIAFEVGTAIGVNALLARKLGEKNEKDANRTAAIGILLAAIDSVAFAVAGILLAPSFIALFTEDPELAGMSVSYIRIIMLFSLGANFGIMGEKIQQGTGDTIRSMYIQIAGAVTNILLDPILIFGMFGFPALGVTGAAIATVIGQHVSALVALKFLFSNREINLEKSHFRMKKALVKDIYAVAAPMIVMQSISGFMGFAMNKILIGFSEAAVSVLNIYYKMQTFVFMPVFGLNSGLVPILGYNYGAKNAKRINEALKVALLISISIMSAGTAIFLLFPHQLLGMFSPTEEMMDIGIKAFRIISFCFIPAGFDITLSALFQATGDGYLTMIISIIRQLAALLPAAWILSRIGGLDMIWYSFMIAETISLILVFIMMKKEYDRRVRPLL